MTLIWVHASSSLAVLLLSEILVLYTMHGTTGSVVSNADASLFTLVPSKHAAC